MSQLADPPTQPHSGAKHSPVALWHLLSLDAPTVATLWTWFVARCAGLMLPVPALTSMFVAVWMLYAADRLLDARVLDPQATPSPSALAQIEMRHRFHQQYRRAFLVSIVLSALALASLLPHLNPEALRLYTLLASLLFAWFLLIHTRLTAARRLPKELAVGLFFPAAVFIPTVSRRPDLRTMLLGPALLFAVVCTLNCLYVYAWEHPTDRNQAHWTTRIATQHLKLISLLIILVTLLRIPLRFFTVVASNVAFSHGDNLLYAAYAVSALFLLLLSAQRNRLSALHLRAVADATLLTPLLFAPFLKIQK